MMPGSRYGDVEGFSVRCDAIHQGKNSIGGLPLAAVGGTDPGVIKILPAIEIDLDRLTIAVANLS
ncbi:MAG: hypothetical protein Kow00121_15940 [Elainellaceae cyanobacterium]